MNLAPWIAAHVKDFSDLVARAAKDLGLQLSKRISFPLTSCGMDASLALGTPRIRPRIVRVVSCPEEAHALLLQQTFSNVLTNKCALLLAMCCADDCRDI